jgi:anti-sigma regulatory factor (Ser/Thr protein kinase)
MKTRTLICDIVTSEDRYWVTAEVTRYLCEAAVPLAIRQRIAICVAELVSNAAKFARHASLCVSAPLEPCAGVGLMIEDDGPGFAEPDRALLDGYSEGRVLGDDRPDRRRGLGVGLGAVARLASSLRIDSARMGGARVEVHLCSIGNCERNVRGER